MKKIITLLAIVFCLNAEAQIITTVAGNGYVSANANSGAYSGYSGQATAAEFSYPAGIAFDALGNLYVADNINGLIRKVNTLGVISTIAGDTTGVIANMFPNLGYSGDGGAATAAKLAGPVGITFDAAGNLYIADYSASLIRKVNTFGIISTIAGDTMGYSSIPTFTFNPGYSGDGGAATNARLDNPSGIAFDHAGNLYLADESNNVIRMINTSGIISTVAGNGPYAGYSGNGGAATAAKLRRPSGIAFDATGNLYIAEQGNYCIRMVNTSGIISTVVGDGTYASSGDGGQATAAKLGGPSGITFDTLGNMYISDISNRIRKINTSGVISTVAGNGINGNSGDGGPATAAELYIPTQVAIDANGNIYIADGDNNRIRVVTQASALTVNSPTICTGNSSTLTVSGATTYTWSPSTGLNIDTGAVVVANPTITTTYTITGKANLNLLNVNDISFDTAIATVFVNPLPSVNYTLTNTAQHNWSAYTTYSSNVDSARWYWGDGTDTVALYPTHIYSVAGRYNICVAAYSFCGDSITNCQDDSVYRYSSSTSNNMVYVNVLNSGQIATAVHQLSVTNNQVSIYPNPTNTSFIIETTGTDKQTLQVFDVNGKLVLSQSINGKANVDATNLSEGVYNISLISPTGVVNKKLVIVK